MSIFFPIKNYLLSRKNRHLRPSVVNRQTVPYEMATHFGILLQIETPQDAQKIVPIFEKLKKDNKKIEIVLFQTKKFKEEIRVPYRFFLVHQEQIDWNGNVDVVAVQKFISTTFDYLFCITEQNIALFERILLLSQAKCRVGAHIVGKEFLYEWMVFAEKDNNVTTLAQKMLESVSSIQSKQAQLV